MLCVGLAAAAGACATRSSTTPSQLDAHEWRLAELEGRAAEPADLSRRPWLRFSMDSSRVSGNLGCNRGGGTFTVNGEDIRFSPIMSTRMACVDEAMNRQETALGAALRDTDRFRIAGDTLELRQGARVLARFTRVP